MVSIMAEIGFDYLILDRQDLKRINGLLMSKYFVSRIFIFL